MGLLNRLSNLGSNLRLWAEGRHGPRSLSQTIRALRGWEITPLASSIFEAQQGQLDQVLSELFGYHLLEMSCFDCPGLSRSSRINHRFRLSPVNNPDAGALADYESLPLASESIDVVILHHVLEYSTHPHQILREANRVLIARGHLVVVGFNPWSLQGGYKILAQWLGAGSFWRRRSLRPGRVMDWLRLLDCEPLHVEWGFYGLPVNHAGVLRQFSFWERFCRRLGLPFGGYYVMLASKDRLCMTPVKPVWSSLNPVAGLVMGKPTPRMPESMRQNHRGDLAVKQDGRAKPSPTVKKSVINT